jgi:hypothetical protein
MVFTSLELKMGIYWSAYAVILSVLIIITIFYYDYIVQLRQIRKNKMLLLYISRGYNVKDFNKYYRNGIDSTVSSFFISLFGAIGSLVEAVKGDLTFQIALILHLIMLFVFAIDLITYYVFKREI